MSAGLLVALLAGLVGLVGALVVGVVTSMVTKEAEARLDTVPVWLLRLARRRIPVSHREELYEEWAAELYYALHRSEDRPLTRLWLGARYALGLQRAGQRVANELGPVRSDFDNRVTSDEQDHLSERPIWLPPVKSGLRRTVAIGLSFSQLREAARIDLADVARDLSAGLTIEESNGYYLLESANYQVIALPRKARISGSPIAQVIRIRRPRRRLSSGKPILSLPVRFHPVWAEETCDLSEVVQADPPPGEQV
jgi:hypothetical protein